MESMKESAANVAVSAKAGMEKTKATVQEKVERLTAHDPLQKEMATEKKEERKQQAELKKQEACDHNAATKHVQTGTHTGHTGYSPTGTGTHTGYKTTGIQCHTTTTVGHHTGTGINPTDELTGGYATTGTTGTIPPGAARPNVPRSGYGSGGTYQ